MYHIKRDKRALASVELICAGLLRLMARKPFEKITITDLQKESTVSRSTFYRNFDCLEDVLELLCDRGFQTIFDTYNAQPPEARGRSAWRCFATGAKTAAFWSRSWPSTGRTFCFPACAAAPRSLTACNFWPPTPCSTTTLFR